jgi:hypothetical protein
MLVLKVDLFPEGNDAAFRGEDSRAAGVVRKRGQVLRLGTVDIPGRGKLSRAFAQDEGVTERGEWSARTIAKSPS